MLAQGFSVFVQWLAAFGFALTGSMTAILIATGALMAMINLRNAHLAERARANVAECMYQLNQVQDEKHFNDRRESLRDQTRKFIRRYELTSYAFIFLAVALTCFAGTAILSHRFIINQQFQPAIAPELGGALGLIASVLSLIGLFIMSREFWIAPRTLDDNSKTAGFLGPTPRSTTAGS